MAIFLLFKVVFNCIFYFCDTNTLPIQKKKRSHHLILTKQIGKSLPLITTAWMIMFQLATRYLTLADAVSVFSFLNQPKKMAMRSNDLNDQNAYFGQ